MKRSSQVALLLMGVTGVGGAGYMMTRPPPDCVPQGSPAATAPLAAGAKALEACPPRRQWSSSSSSGSSYRSSWTRTNNSSSNSSGWPIFSRASTSATPSTSVPLSGRSAGIPSTPPSRSAATTTRSGFGSTASSVSRSSSGG